MGSFNTINVPCPKCNYEMPVQTKAGSCMMEDKGIYEADLAELQDVVMADLVCEGCGSELEVVVQPHIWISVDNKKRKAGLN